MSDKLPACRCFPNKRLTEASTSWQLVGHFRSRAMSRIPKASQAEAISPAHRILHASQSDIVQLGRRIGAGAEGEVYEIQDKSDLVAKVYHEPPPPEKAEKLVVLSRLGNERLFNLSAWPVSTLRDAPDGE